MIVINFFTAAAVRLRLWFDALAGLALLLAGGAGALARGEKLQGVATSPEGLRRIFAILRAAQPNLVLSQTFVASYPCRGTAVVSRFADVKDVLARPLDFEVVYQPRMEIITGGANFFLGMQDTPTYTRDVSNMRLTARREDAAAIIAPFVAREASALVAACPGRIDVPRQLGLPLAARFLDHYFTPTSLSEDEAIEINSLLFRYLFIDLAADPAIGAAAATAAARLRAAVGEAVAKRKSEPEPRDDVLGRCLKLQASGTPGMDDLAIRNNLIGLMIGAVATTSRAATQALDQLLDRPWALIGAQKAARDNDETALANHVFEALRFNPINPVIYRRAARDCFIGGHSWRRRAVPKGTMVMAANLSAMFDPLVLDSPGEFNPDRPWSHYLLWGDGQHLCFGAYVNRVAIPGLLKPLLQKQGLRRAQGAEGRIDCGDTPFPIHFTVCYDD